jgi:chemotaxis protein CheD
MYKNYSRRLKRIVLTLTPGEYYVSQDLDIISSMLGSCISACIFDVTNKIGGMNHFMLPSQIDPDNLFYTKTGRYGMYTMELLIGDLIKLGAERKNLKAKIFGGSNILKFRNTEGNIPDSNIQFTKKFLEMEQIPLLAMDVGGCIGRKILFFTDTGTVLLKKLVGISKSAVIYEELFYTRNLLRRRIENSKTPSSSSVGEEGSLGVGAIKGTF